MSTTINDRLKARLQQAVDNHLPAALALYRHIHANPELSGQERATAGLRYYLEYVRRMAAGFAAVLRDRHAALERLAGPGVGTEHAME